MSELSTWWMSIWDELVNKVTSLEEFSTDTVFYGEKFPPTQFPSAYVCPSSAESEPATFHETFWNPTFEILIVTENSDVKAGFQEAWSLAWKIIETLQQDRQLNGLLHNLECPRIASYPRGLGRGMEQHWVSITVLCLRKR